jgi:hypothetical protein
VKESVPGDMMPPKGGNSVSTHAIVGADLDGSMSTRRSQNGILVVCRR